MTQATQVLDERASGGKRLLGKKAVVTGGGQGHGRATVKRFAEEGASVMIADRNAPGAERVRDELLEYGAEVDIWIGDVGNPEGAKDLMAKAVDRFGRLDILVNVVGGAFRLPDSGRLGWEKTPEDLIANIQNNLFTCLWCCWAAMPYMVKQESGSIINFGSHAVRGTDRLGYAAAKGGIAAITTSMALELAPHNVRINMVIPHVSSRAPGDVLVGRIPGNEMSAADKAARSAAPAVNDPHLSFIPMNRPGTPEEVAAAVTFFASDDASFTTAESICVGGGAFCRL
jgi:dihydroxycyclohexadiene carboxylate dehydrogenase